MDQAVKERDDHLKEMKSTEMLKKKQELEEIEKQLKDIERQCGMFVGLGVWVENTFHAFHIVDF